MSFLIPGLARNAVRTDSWLLCAFLDTAFAGMAAFVPFTVYVRPIYSLWQK